jgi:hypothetical protein
MFCSMLDLLGIFHELCYIINNSKLSVISYLVLGTCEHVGMILCMFVCIEMYHQDKNSTLDTLKEENHKNKLWMLYSEK